MALSLFLLGKERGEVLMGVLLLVTAGVEAARLYFPAVNGPFIRLLGPMLKESEAFRPTGVGYYVGGVLLSLLFFDLEVALAGLVILAVGDPAAAWTGRRWGRRRIGDKTLEGSVGFFVAAILAGVLFQGFWPGISLPLFAIGAMTGAVVECLPLKIDDNLILPLAASFAIQIAG
jgi:dolichol kinase